ncbi:MAG: 50S ribosomal protein L4 [Candidatus Brocadiia bacterium]
MQISVYNAQGELVEEMEVDEVSLGGEPNMALIRQALVAHEANCRLGTVRVKRRREVVRSRRKPWAQKHTGRARHGDRGSPIWVGGGSAHGPRPRDYGQRMPRKARRRAVESAFLAKALDGEVIGLTEVALPEPKTRHVAAMLRNLGVEDTFLIVVPEHDPELWRCARNIQGAAMCTWEELNAYRMIRPRRVIFLLGALEQFLSRAAGMQALNAIVEEEILG